MKLDEYMENEKELYIKQLEYENTRLKNSIKSLRNNNKSLKQSVDKLNARLIKYRKQYGNLKED